jgi:hypothetical protein
VLTLLQRFNRNKAVAIFHRERDNIISRMRSFSPIEVLQLLSFLKEVTLNDSLIRETAIELLYNEIKHLNPSELSTLLQCLAVSKKYVNKDFLVRVG